MGQLHSSDTGTGSVGDEEAVYGENNMDAESVKGEKETESAVTESVDYGEAIFKVDYLSTDADSDVKSNILSKDKREVMTSAKSKGDNGVPKESIEDTPKKKDSVKEDELLSPLLCGLSLESSPSGCNLPLDTNTASSQSEIIEERSL